MVGVQRTHTCLALRQHFYSCSPSLRVWGDVWGAWVVLCLRPILPRRDSLFLLLNCLLLSHPSLWAHSGGRAAGQGQSMHTSQGAAPFVAVTVGAGNDEPKRRLA